MNLSTTNLNLPHLRSLTSFQKDKRRLSSSTHSSSFSSSTASDDLNSIPILIQICFYPNENYAYQTLKTLLFSPQYRYSTNVSDEFGCNLLMYTLRYQRYRLFDFLLNDVSLDLNLRSKDRQGNTILHYAVIYGGDNTHIMENLIEKFNSFGIDMDGRNVLGFTPLLFAAFCGRYDLASILLTKSNASPFVQDYIQQKNLIDYLKSDTKEKDFIKKVDNNYSSSRLSRESSQRRAQLQQTLHPRSESSQNTKQNPRHQNFFENILSEAVQDRSGSIRSLILSIHKTDDSSLDLIHLLSYINRRYPQINTQINQDHSQHRTTPTIKIGLQRTDSNTSLHNIFTLFDPDLRSKAVIPKLLLTTTLPTQPLGKTQITTQRLASKIKMLTALSRPNLTKKTSRSSSRSSTK